MLGHFRSPSSGRIDRHGSYVWPVLVSMYSICRTFFVLVLLFNNGGLAAQVASRLLVPHVLSEAYRRISNAKTFETLPAARADGHHTGITR